MSALIRTNRTNVYLLNSSGHAAALTRSGGTPSVALRERLATALNCGQDTLLFARSPKSGRWYVSIDSDVTRTKTVTDLRPVESALATFWDQLERHDWYYEMSDDHSVWKRGHAAHDRLLEMAKTIEGGADLFKAFSAHYYTGAPWGNVQQPKPARPTN
jgi:hypothetical protein